MSSKNRKGQAIVDYLVIAGIVLVLALIVIGLASSLPNLGQDIQTRSDLNYWRTDARPFVISDAFYRTNNSRFYMALNMQTDDEFNLSGLFINGTQLAFYTYNASYADGADALECGSSTCSGTPCACDYPLHPDAAGSIVTEPYESPIPVCGPDEQQSQLTLQLVYFRPSNPAQNLTESGSVPLPFSCQ